MKQEPAPNEVIVWHNGDAQDQPGCINIRAGKNWGCVARHVIGQLCSSWVVIFVDDDVNLWAPDVCNTLMHKTIANWCVTGWHGRRLATQPPYYTNGEDKVGGGAVDIVKGLLHAVPRTTLSHLTSVWDVVEPIDPEYEDDIAISAASVNQPQLVDFPRSAIELIKDGYGLQQRKNHHEIRDKMCEKLVAERLLLEDVLV